MIHTLIKQLYKRKSGYLTQILYCQYRLEKGLEVDDFEIFEDAQKANKMLNLQMAIIIEELEELAKNEIFKP